MASSSSKPLKFLLSRSSTLVISWAPDIVADVAPVSADTRSCFMRLVLGWVGIGRRRRSARASLLRATKELRAAGEQMRQSCFPIFFTSARSNPIRRYWSMPSAIASWANWFPYAHRDDWFAIASVYWCTKLIAQYGMPFLRYDDSGGDKLQSKG